EDLAQGGTYSMRGALRLTGALQVALLRQCVVDLVARHEALRTTFALHDDELLQVISETAQVDFQEVDLRAGRAAASAGEVAEWVERDARRPFDLSAGPLLRVAVLQLGAAEHLALFSVHHCVADGWSLRVVIEELAALYNARSAGAEGQLPELTLSYA